MIRKLMVVVAVLGIAGTGALAQGVTFSGSGDLGVKYAGDTKNEAGNVTMKSSFTWVSNFDLAMSASGTTDGGLTFGAGATVKAGNSESVVGASNAYISGESWKISIGDLDPASHKGQSIGDVGFDGLGVDDVAEKAVGATAADVEVSFTLGAASLAITAGQSPGTARVDGSNIVYGIYSPKGGNYVKDLKLGALQYIGKDADGDYVVKAKTSAEDTITADDQPVDLTELGGTANQAIMVKSPAVTEKAATKQDTQWAAGVSFDIGSTTLGIGMDSEKLMQASLGADLGAFGGKLFYTQQKESGVILDDKGDAFRTMLTGVNGIFDDAADHTAVKKDDTMIDRKKTGIGVEISFAAGANTTINAVYAQGKNSDTRSSVGYSVSNGTLNDAGTAYENSDGAPIDSTQNGYESIEIGADSAKAKTDKAFGIGVSHSLGGGATLNAGFAKVKEVSMASVGVSMSF